MCYYEFTTRSYDIMSKFRYTVKELNEHSDMWFILRFLEDRLDSCTNVYSPLYEKIRQIQEKIIHNKPLTNQLYKGSWLDMGVK